MSFRTSESEVKNLAEQHTMLRVRNEKYNLLNKNHILFKKHDHDIKPHLIKRNKKTPTLL